MTIPNPDLSAPCACRRAADRMARLRGADGCPWDREQTHRSLIPYLIEETYETIDAVESGDPAALCDELGDVVWQVVFHAQLAAERGEFTLDDVFTRCADKMERRHPHVFDPQAKRPLTGGEVSANWEEIKRRERGGDAPQGDLTARGPTGLPALARAQDVQRRAARVGFDWPHREGVLAKLDEELAEFRRAADGGDLRRVSAELGDLLFTLVNLARAFDVDPETALRGSTRRFAARFAHMEGAAGGSLAGMSAEALDRLWRAAKAAESATDQPA